MRIDVNAIKNFKTLPIPARLLFMIFFIAGDDGAFRFKCSDMANRIGTSERTVRSYVKVFVDCDLLKYKYSGSGRLNPNFYYAGNLSKFHDDKNAYVEFKSDF